MLGSARGRTRGIEDVKALLEAPRRRSPSHALDIFSHLSATF
jgi:hypothetical protein